MHIDAPELIEDLVHEKARQHGGKALMPAGSAREGQEGGKELSPELRGRILAGMKKPLPQVLSFSSVENPPPE